MEQKRLAMELNIPIVSIDEVDSIDLAIDCVDKSKVVDAIEIYIWENKLAHNWSSFEFH